jgi:hypothetical protein
VTISGANRVVKNPKVQPIWPGAVGKSSLREAIGRPTLQGKNSTLLACKMVQDLDAPL